MVDAGSIPISMLLISIETLHNTISSFHLFPLLCGWLRSDLLLKRDGTDGFHAQVKIFTNLGCITDFRNAILVNQVQGSSICGVIVRENCFMSHGDSFSHFPTYHEMNKIKVPNIPSLHATFLLSSTPHSCLLTRHILALFHSTFLLTRHILALPLHILAYLHATFLFSSIPHSCLLTRHILALFHSTFLLTYTPHSCSLTRHILALFHVGLHFGSKNPFKISIVFEDLSRNSVFFRTEVKPYFHTTFLRTYTTHFCSHALERIHSWRSVSPPRPPPNSGLPLASLQNVCGGGGERNSMWSFNNSVFLSKMCFEVNFLLCLMPFLTSLATKWPKRSKSSFPLSWHASNSPQHRTCRPKVSSVFLPTWFILVGRG